MGGRGRARAVECAALVHESEAIKSGAGGGPDIYLDLSSHWDLQSHNIHY